MTAARPPAPVRAGAVGPPAPVRAGAVGLPALHRADREAEQLAGSLEPGASSDGLVDQPAEETTLLRLGAFATQADIVAISNSYSSITCNNTKQKGIHVFGDPKGQWVGTRRVWNQHAYHVTKMMYPV